MSDLKDEHDFYWLYLIKNSEILQFSEDFQSNMKELAGISIIVGDLLPYEKKLEYYKEGILYFDISMEKLNLRKNENIKSQEKLIKLLAEIREWKLDMFMRIEKDIVSKNIC